MSIKKHNRFQGKCLYLQKTYSYLKIINHGFPHHDINIRNDHKRKISYYWPDLQRSEMSLFSLQLALMKTLSEQADRCDINGNQIKPGLAELE